MNTKMNILKGLGIILVVAGHTGGGHFFHWFPVYSYHMPLFLFISGYFYKPEAEKNISQFVTDKTAKLLFPYYGWNLFYGLLVSLLLYYKVVNFGGSLSFHNLIIEPWFTGYQYIFNLAGWFVLMLFCVFAFYIVSRKILTKIIASDFLLTLIYVGMAMLGLYLSQQGLNRGISLVINRTIFGLFFFHLGYLYRIKIEKYDNISFIRLIMLVFFQGLLIYMTPNLEFVMVSMSFGKDPNIITPLLSSLTGIYLFLQIAAMIDKATNGHEVVLTLFGKNTWSIMIHQFFAFWIVNIVLATSMQLGFSSVSGFNMALFRSDITYRYLLMEEVGFLIYPLAGLFIPIAISRTFTILLETVRYQKLAHGLVFFLRR